jgi:hypothetical protein
VNPGPPVLREPAAALRTRIPEECAVTRTYLAGRRALTLSATALVLLAAACGDDDNGGGAGEEELINEVTMTLAPVGGGAAEEATITDDLAGTLTQDRTLVLQPGITYNGAITLTNSTVTPPIDITEEVILESDEHRFFYTVTPSGSGVTVTNLDLDNNGVVFGQTFQVVVDAGAASGPVGINVLLSHFDDEPKGDGSVPSDETDIDVNFEAELD